MRAYDSRQRRLFALLAKRGTLPYLITHSPDIRYLTGFSGSEGLLIVCERGFIFGSDGRYMEQAKREVCADDIDIYRRRREFFGKWLPRGGKVYFDRERLSFLLFRELGGMGREPVPASSPLKKMRARKDRWEAETIQRAAIIATTSFVKTLHENPPPATEREFAAFLEWEMKKMGADGVSFPPIVAAGERSSFPHASPGDGALWGEKVVLFDFGCTVAGYCSDETVTLTGFFGETWMKRRVLDAVRRARDAALGMIRPGIACRDVDRKTREVIDKEGFGRYFVHSTGHGVGLEVHESPTISPYSREVLKEGMVVTVEPGVYIPGEGGVRFEDLVLVTGRGHEKLTYFPKTGVYPGEA